MKTKNSIASRSFNDLGKIWVYDRQAGLLPLRLAEGLWVRKKGKDHPRRKGSEMREDMDLPM